MNQKRLDFIGISLSALCLAHCLILPFFMLSLPILARYYLAHPWAHLILALMVLPVVLLAVWRGYRLHQNSQVIWLAIVGGLLLLVTSVFKFIADTFIATWELELMALGSGFIILAHLINLSKCRSCMAAPRVT